MEPLTTAALIGGGAALGGTLISSALGVSEAQKNRDFQERMASTQHQRQMEDMRKAGLNPALSAQYGGAASPAGSMASIPDLGHSAKTAVDALSAASQLRVANAQAENIEAEAALKKLDHWERGQTQESRLRMYEAELFNKRANTRLTDAQEEKVEKEIKNVQKQLEIMEVQRQSSSFGLSEAEAQSKFYESIGGDIAPWVRMLGINPSIIPGIGGLLKGKGRPTRRRSQTTTRSGNRTDTETIEYDLPERR